MQYNTLCNIIHYVYIYNIYNLTICRLGYICSSRMYIIQLFYHSIHLVYMPQVNVLFDHCHLPQHNIRVVSLAQHIS